MYIELGLAVRAGSSPLPLGADKLRTIWQTILTLQSSMKHAWRDAILATGLISSVPTLVLPFIPHDATKSGSSLQRVLLCFAVGGMMGDVFLHLLPHLMMGGYAHQDHHGHHDDHNHGAGNHFSSDIHSNGVDKGASLETQIDGDPGQHAHTCESAHTHEHGATEYAHVHSVSDLVVPVTILAGFLIFFISERIVRAWAGIEDLEPQHAHGHTHNHGLRDAVGRRKKDDDDRTLSCPDKKSSTTALKISGILNLAADALHNLSDGIAIGAAFATGSGLGYSTALATLLHELPHEIGDFAVLVQSGMSKWQAIGAQFATATAAFAGTVIGLFATSCAGVEKLLLAATAGGFVYVSCVGVMPGILNGRPSFLMAVAELIAMCSGIALMAAVALLE